MRFRLLEIQKETFKLLGNYLGLKYEQKTTKSHGNFYPNADTPDSYNSRQNTSHRKNLSTTRHPG